MNPEENSGANHGDDDFSCLGAYRISIFPLKNDGLPDHEPARWDDMNTLKSSQPQYNLHPRLLKILSREVTRRRLSGKRVRGYTEARAKFGDQTHIFRSAPAATPPSPATPSWPLTPRPLSLSLKIRLNTSPLRPGIDTQHDSAKLRDKKRKAQCPSLGSIPFQIQIVEMLQKNGCPMKMHDEIIDLINNSLITGSLHAANPPLFSQKNVSSRTGL